MIHYRHPFIVNITRCGCDVERAEGIVVTRSEFLYKPKKQRCKQCQAYIDLQLKLK